VFPVRLPSRLNQIETLTTLFSSVRFLLFSDTPSFPAMGILEDHPGGSDESARATALADDATIAYSQGLK
jgi:hypothetical protein